MLSRSHRDISYMSDTCIGFELGLVLSEVITRAMVATSAAMIGLGGVWCIVGSAALLSGEGAALLTGSDFKLCCSLLHIRICSTNFLMTATLRAAATGAWFMIVFKV